jgi:hypothetical protein
MSIEPQGVVRLQGILDGKNASAVSFFGNRLLVTADELTNGQNLVQVFEPDGSDFRLVPGGSIALDPAGGNAVEMDLEGLAVDGSDVFVVGSHSYKRKKVEPDKTQAKNRERLLKVPELEPARDVLLHFKLDPAGPASAIERSSLRDFLDNNQPFQACGNSAGKENGIDVEGLAKKDGWLYVGFRGPVLRGNFTPIVRCRFGSPIVLDKILFVDLGGRGVRDLARVGGGLLILAGPVGDGPGTFQLYLWDGRDMVPGSDVATVPGLRFLGDLPPPVSDAGLEELEAKAEGLALEEETSTAWKVLVVYDGLVDGHATRFTVSK